MLAGGASKEWPFSLGVSFTAEGANPRPAHPARSRGRHPAGKGQPLRLQLSEKMTVGSRFLLSLCKGSAWNSCRYFSKPRSAVATAVSADGGQPLARPWRKNVWVTAPVPAMSQGSWRHVPSASAAGLRRGRGLPREKSHSCFLLSLGQIPEGGFQARDFETFKRKVGT